MSIIVNKPKIISSQLKQLTECTLQNEVYFDDAHCSQFHHSLNAVYDVTIRGCYIDRAALMSAKLPKLRIFNTVIEKANLANGDWEESNLERVQILGSRLTGLKIADGIIQDVHIQNSRLDLCEFRFSHFKNVIFENCVLNDSDFLNANLENVEFVGCDLQNAQFSQAKLKQVDMSGSKIDGIKMSADQLRGLTIDAGQLYAIIHILGVNIK